MVNDDKRNLFIKIVSSCIDKPMPAIRKRVYAILKKLEFLELINSLIAFVMPRVLVKVLPDNK